jgi:hypothetical protein
VLFHEELDNMRKAAKRKHDEKEHAPTTQDSLFEEEEDGLSKQGFNNALKTVSRKLPAEASSQPDEGKKGI